MPGTSKRWLSAAGLTTAVVILAVADESAAAPLGPKGKQGIALASAGDCDAALPLLEEAEAENSRPATAFYLADCLAQSGKIPRAMQMLQTLAETEPEGDWTWADKAAHKQAGAKAEELSASMATLTFEVQDDYPNLRIEVDGQEVDPLEITQIAPEEAHKVKLTAKGHETLEFEVTASPGETVVVPVELEKGAAEPKEKPKDKPEEEPEEEDASGRSEYWIGGRFRGLIIPQFLMGAFGDGGTTVFSPGGGLTVTAPLSELELVMSVHYQNYFAFNIPFKESGTPNTEWEIIDSNLQSLLATVDLMWDIPLNPELSFRIGGGVGLGWTFVGDITRTQAYPTGDADDPATYTKCVGPNNPPGTYRYCNQLDKDADHYGDYAEPSWFEGGARPLVYPWIALPQLGLAWYPTDQFAVDLEVGASISGILTGLGIRFGL